MSKTVATYSVRIHLTSDEAEPAEPPTLAEVEAAVEAAITPIANADVGVSAERVDE